VPCRSDLTTKHTGTAITVSGAREIDAAVFAALHSPHAEQIKRAAGLYAAAGF
jgi:hypothetical protein